MPYNGVSITDTGTPKIRALIAGLKNKEHLKPVGQAAVRSLMDHFAEKNQSPDSHKTAMSLGAKPRQLFAQFARSTQYQTGDHSVTISVNHVAARQRYEGGTIVPVNSKYLAIPAIAEAYGLRPRETPALIPMIRRIGGQAKAVALEMPAGFRNVVERKRKGKRVLVDKGAYRTGIWYWLVDSVTQRADPTVLPEMTTLQDDVSAALSGWIDRIKGA